MVTSTRTERIAARCVFCDLRQFKRPDDLCRRCGKALPDGAVESTTVILVGRALEPETPVAQLAFGAILPLRVVMQRAAVEAVGICRATTKAAKALGVSHSRLKQLLREAGDETDYRERRRR